MSNKQTKRLRFHFISAARTNQAFTIVELLIVIVIIAILATITVVAYKGIQDRAYSAKAASITDTYMNLFEMYQADNDSYPDTNGNYICLGSVDDYPADGTYNSGECSHGGGPNGPDMAVDEDFNAQLKTINPTIPSGSLPNVADGPPIRGIYYIGDSDGGTISYTLKGDQTCPKGETDNYGDSTDCTIGIGDESGNYGGSGGNDT
ncbi:MAG: prepilin-type N-terminal cleavage/methylation domain-containing protein [Candidatus Saccharimonas sp.]